MKSRYFKPALIVMAIVGAQMFGFLLEPKIPGASANTTTSPTVFCAPGQPCNYADSFNVEMKELQAKIQYIVTNQ